ncbi:MAG: hypothetical protein WBO73_17850, partial [Gammaproteobacteria bacterium]
TYRLRYRTVMTDIKMDCNFIKRLPGIILTELHRNPTRNISWTSPAMSTRNLIGGHAIKVRYRFYNLS